MGIVSKTKSNITSGSAFMNSLTVFPNVNPYIKTYIKPPCIRPSLFTLGTTKTSDYYRTEKVKSF